MTQQVKIQPSEQGYWDFNGSLTLAAIYTEGDSFAIFHGVAGQMELTTCSCSSDGSPLTASILKKGTLPSGKTVVWYEDNRFALFNEQDEFLYSTGFAFKPRTPSVCDGDHCDDAHECIDGQAHLFGGDNITCLN